MIKEDKLKNLERVNFWITNCDTKVSFLLIIQGVVLSIIFTSSYSAALLETLNGQFSVHNLCMKAVLNFVEGSSLTLFFGFVLLSFYNIYSVLAARLNPSVFKESGLEINSLLFFNTIANRNYSKFKTDIQNTTEADLDNDLDSQVYINSKICTLKFYYYNKALNWSAWGFIFALIYLALKLKINA